jgi:ribosome-dependent ATPase
MVSSTPSESSAGIGGKPVVSVKDVTHRYGKVVALDGISLDIPRKDTAGDGDRSGWGHG